MAAAPVLISVSRICNLCTFAGERMYAHGGIVAAAAAILADMEQHNLLQRLLEEYDPLDQQHQQPSHRSAHC